MQASSIGIWLSASLLAAALAEWTLISLLFFLGFLYVPYELNKPGRRRKPRFTLWALLVLSLSTCLLGVILVIIWCALGTGWSISKTSILRVFGFDRLNPSQGLADVFLFFVPKIAVVVCCSCGLYHEYCGRRTSFVLPENRAYEVRAALRSFALPTVQVIAGSVFPCWVALPYFICSCTGLFHWAVTSNFVGLSWGWRPLLVYNALHISALYLRQLLLRLPLAVTSAADYLGIFSVTDNALGWAKVSEGVCAIALYVLLCFAIGDMEELGRPSSLHLRTTEDSDVEESLLQHAPSERWQASERRRLLIFREAAVCFFACGFPICLVALVCWSFKFASFCALVLLLYVGFILYVYPSLFLLRRLNEVLLGFILFWAFCTYVFNAGFTIMTSRYKLDTAIWQTVGLWRYSSPGLFIMAQFALGVLVATDLFAGNSILENLEQSDHESALDGDDNAVDEQQSGWILAMAVAAWCLHRSAHVISLVLIFVVALRSGLMHALYMGFFVAYLLSPGIAKRTRSYLMLYCELHIGVLYVLHLEWISAIIERHKMELKPILSQLGIWNKATVRDYMAIAALLCFCAIQSHGIKVICSLSAAAQQGARYSPFFLSIYGSHSVSAMYGFQIPPSARENWITRYLAYIGEKFRASYRSFGTYIVYGAVIISVCSAEPNFVSFGYLVLLLFWIVGRQILGKTEWPFWIPLFGYTFVVFVGKYILSVFPDLQLKAAGYVRLRETLGFDPQASLLSHLWDSLTILAVMQLYKYERLQPSLSELGTSVTASEFLDFIKRFLILHSGKILYITVFYASISPVSGFGFVYIILMVLTCNVRKTSCVPSQIYAVYTSILLALEYVYQIFGKQAGTDPAQVHGAFVYWLGLRVYNGGFWGMEAGGMSKALVLGACMLQYCCFQWLSKLPAAWRRSDEPCLLFQPSSGLHKHYASREPLLSGRPADGKRSEGGGSVSPASSVLSRETSRESKKWNRRAMILKQEKYDAQLNALKGWVTYLLEHFFTVYGIEVNMLSLLVASFAALNIFSLVYVLVLALCILLTKRHIRFLWPCFVALFACILVGEYATLAKLPPSWNLANQMPRHCHDCWKTSRGSATFCWRCWLGAIDDRQMLVAYFMVFMVSTFQLTASKLSETASFHAACLVANRRLAWSEISYESTEEWTWLDYLRFAFYRHLLHAVLLLVFITGTLQYDLLHLGYLAFSMIFFRMRTTIMNRKNTIFRFLRLYNFCLIVASLIFQAPFFAFLDGRGCTPFSIFGLYKYDYGFRITARSALVDITIFCLVGLQSQIFRTREFDQVLRYLAAEQVEARARAQEAKAAWKKEQLRTIRELEEKKLQRRRQVEKMKLDIVPMQLRLDVLNSASKFKETLAPFRIPESPTSLAYADSLTDSGVRKRLVNSFSDSDLVDHGHETMGKEGVRRRRRKLNVSTDSEADAVVNQLNLDSPSRPSTQVSPTSKKGHGLLSGVTFLEDGVAQVHHYGNKALANLVGLLNLELPESDDSSSAEDDMKATQNEQSREPSVQPVTPPAAPPSEARRRLSMICSYLCSKIITNTDIVCYVLFVLVYVWNFSLLTLVFPGSLFLYALLVNPGPTQMFWSAMLIYTEFSILLQYMYQIIVNHCGHDDIPLWLKKFGVSGRNMNRSFVASVLPLFLVYLATLVQSSIKAREGEWMFVTEGNTFSSSRRVSESEIAESYPRPSKSRLCGFWDVVTGACIGTLKTLIRCWTSLTNGSEVPPHFVQVTLSVPEFEDGIQPERIQSAFNKLLQAVKHEDNNNSSRVRVESMEFTKETDHTAIAVLEVIYAAPPTCSTIERLLFTSLTPASDVAAEIKQAKNREEDFGFPYRIVSVVAGGKKQIDLYAYIFGTDLIAFLYAALFYQSFIKNSPEFLDVYQLEDQFPKEFVFVLMTLFFLIVLDRVLYLSACAIGKVFYYFFTLVLYTSYVTAFVWSMELPQGNAVFFQLLPLRGFYLLKALSLSLQAAQLRYGIPRKSTLFGQFLMRKVSSLSWLGFRIYRALPFLFELRCVLDWSCTTTALSMYDWLKLEDIYASLFLVQCDIKLAREKHRLGEKRGMWLKFCNGLCLFFVLICVIWAPMLIYSSGNPTNFVNDILAARTQIELRTSGGSFTIFDTKQCRLLSRLDIPASCNVDPSGSLDSFDAKDIQLACCEEDADLLWLISPPTLRTLINSFDDKVELISSWDFHRERPKNKEVVTFTGQPVEAGSLRGVLNGEYDSVVFDDLYPRYFRITSAGEVRILEQTDVMVSGNLTLNRETQPWWSFTRTDTSRKDGCGTIRGPLAVTVSEEVPKGLIGDTLSQFNIWSLYITFVLAVGRFIRLQCADLRMRIPYENFPSCERLIAICEDIYAARAEGELELEEGLFWTLVKIYRSPHILIEYTKTE